MNINGFKVLRTNFILFYLILQLLQVLQIVASPAFEHMSGNATVAKWFTISSITYLNLQLDNLCPHEH